MVVFLGKFGIPFPVAQAEFFALPGSGLPDSLCQMAGHHPAQLIKLFLIRDIGQQAEERNLCLVEFV